MQKKTHQKILFLAEVFLKIWLTIQLLYVRNYYTCANFKSRYHKTTLGTFFLRKPCMVEVSNSVVMFNKMIEGIFEFFMYANYGHFYKT